MNSESVAPCGVICDICLGFQRDKNKCVGCKSIGNKPHHCTVCSIKSCPEKSGDENALCYECKKFPCRRIRDLDKRYTTKYGESPIQNLERIRENGIEEFVLIENEKWKCRVCGNLLCVHREVCLSCGSRNQYFPDGE
jgi:hypothetical protein